MSGEERLEGGAHRGLGPHSNEMVDAIDLCHSGVLPCGDGRGDIRGRTELVVLGCEEVLGSHVARREQAARDHRDRRCDREPCRHERVGGVEGDGRTEGVAAHHDGLVWFDHVGELARRREVETFGVAVVVDSARVAHSSKVDCDRMAPERHRRTADCGHHVVVTVAAIEGVRVPDDHRRARGVGVGAEDVGLDEHCVDRLERNGFGRHANDGTVPCVPDETQRLPIKMLNDRLLVKIPQSEGERRSSGGILIPATAQISKRLVWAEVVALGANVRAAEAGDRVLFSPDDRYEVEVGGVDYIMLRERDIHAVAAARNEASTGLYI